MAGVDLFQGVKSKAGGLIGQNHNVTITDIMVVEHHLESKGDDKKTVTARYPTSCYTKLTLFVEDAEVDPQYRTGDQYLQVGRLPLWRTQQLGEQPDKNQITYPGGFMPALDPDGNQPATAGPFVRVEGEDGIWEGAEHHLFFGELATLASSAGQLERLKAEVAAKGVAALKGLRCHLGTKAKPRSKKAAAAAKPGAIEEVRSALVPDRINQWPWEAAAAAAAAGGVGVAANVVANVAVPGQAPPAPLPPAPAVPAPAPAFVAPVTVAAPVVPAVAMVQQQQQPTTPPASSGGDFDQTATGYIQAVVKAAGGTMPLADLVGRVFAATTDVSNGADRTQIMQRVYNADWVAGQAAKGAFLSDGKTIMYAGA